jgi:hypothetical protein
MKRTTVQARIKKQALLVRAKVDISTHVDNWATTHLVTSAGSRAGTSLALTSLHITKSATKVFTKRRLKMSELLDLALQAHGVLERRSSSPGDNRDRLDAAALARRDATARVETASPG